MAKIESIVYETKLKHFKYFLCITYSLIDNICVDADPTRPEKIINNEQKYSMYSYSLTKIDKYNRNRWKWVIEITRLFVLNFLIKCHATNGDKQLFQCIQRLLT